ncbi:MAG TPA: hypothetical protein VGB97_00160 [Candidatus Paceibacterota bacterium]|jgi:hypothetical protein
MTEETKVPLTGVLHVHAETGSEGGFWAFQDDRFITENTTRFTCKQCHLYWDKSAETEEQVLEKAAKHGSEKQRTCEHQFEVVSPMNWSYEGQRILATGDRLKIFSKDDPACVIWEGEVNVKNQDTAHYDKSGDFAGYGMHAEPVDLPEEWPEWFSGGYRAELVPH